MLLFTALIEPPAQRALFEELYYTYRASMFRIAYGILHSETLSEDAVSESFLKIAKNIKKISALSGKERRSYLVVIIRNTAKDLYRKRAGEPETAELTGDLVASGAVSDCVLGELGYRRLLEAIGELPEIYRDVLKLRCQMELSATETARLLGITENVVHTRLSRARGLLAQKLEREGDMLL